MKELWVTGSTWGADRWWCWRIERVIIQSFGDELVLVLAGSPGSQITPNQASIDHMRTYPGTVWKQFHWAKVVMLIKECHQWPQDQCTQLLSLESEDRSSGVNRCWHLIFCGGLFVFYFIHILRCNIFFRCCQLWLNWEHQAHCRAGMMVMIVWYLLSNVSN